MCSTIDWKVGSSFPQRNPSIFLVNMKESDNIELYLQSFENEMTQIDVEQDRWKSLITVRLTAKMKAYICDIQRDPASSYQEIKTCRLANAGLSQANASQHCFALQPV